MADKRTGTGEERTPTTRGVALLEKLGVPRRIEVEEEYLSPVGAMTRKAVSPSRRGVSSLSPGRSAARRAASVPVDTPRGRGARAPPQPATPGKGSPRDGEGRGGCARSLPAPGLLP